MSKRRQMRAVFNSPGWSGTYFAALIPFLLVGAIGVIMTVTTAAARGVLDSYVPKETDRSAFANHAREGIRLFVAGQYQAAIEQFSKAIQLEPDNALAYYHRGISYQRLRAQAEALSDFTVAIEKGPPNDFAYLNRGAVRAKLGLLLEAESDFNAALKIDPTRPDTYYNRSLLFLKTNRIQMAIDDITTGIGLNPKDAKAYYLRANALEMLHRHDEVRRDLDEALRLDPTFAPARRLLDSLKHK